MDQNVEDQHVEQSLTLIRITVVGGKQSGKTSLINAFVNNYCPSVYSETHDPALYYKTLHLGKAPDRGDAAGNTDAVAEDMHSALDAMFPVLAEIEDTYAVERNDGRDCYGLPRDISHFLNIFRTQKEQEHREHVLSGVGTHNQDVGPPCRGNRKDPGKYCPVTLNRMGFMIVFDMSDQASLEEAMEAHKKLMSAMKNRTHHLEPVVFIVGTKADKLQDNSDNATKVNGEIYAKRNRLNFREVSAMKLRTVKMVFREVLREIQDRPGLWRVRAASHKYELPALADAKPLFGMSQSGFLPAQHDEAPARRTAALTEVVQGATESCQAPCKMQ